LSLRARRTAAVRIASFWVALSLGRPSYVSAIEEASPAAVAAAETTFKRARDLLDAGRFEEAAVAFQESHRQAPSAGALLNLGVCFEKLGKTASAWAAFTEAIKLARARGEPAKVEKGEELLAAVEPRLSRLVVRPTEPAPELLVRRGDVTLGAASFGVPVPVDPGVLELRAEAPNRQPIEMRVTVEPGATVEIDLPALALLPAQRAGAFPDVPATVDGPPLLLVLGGVVGGVGVVGLAVGATLGGLVLSERAELEADSSLCPARVCSEEGFDRVSSLRGTATASTALWVGGGLLTAAGITLIALELTGVFRGDTKVALGLSGATLRGSF
jgi:tetratricopeptide (TPR) repeat protein